MTPHREHDSASADKVAIDARIGEVFGDERAVMLTDLSGSRAAWLRSGSCANTRCRAERVASPDMSSRPVESTTLARLAVTTLATAGICALFGACDAPAPSEPPSEPGQSEPASTRTADETPPAEPLPARFRAALAARSAGDAGDAASLWIRMEEIEELETPSGKVRVTREAEHLLRGTDALATRASESGVITRKAVRAQTSWLRQGAAVRTASDEEAAALRLLRDDLLCLLVTPLTAAPFRTVGIAPEGITEMVLIQRDGEPDRILTFETDEPHASELLRVADGDGPPFERPVTATLTLMNWTDGSGVWFPRAIGVHRSPAGGGASGFSATVVAIGREPPADAKPPAFERPDDAGGALTSEIERRQVKAANVVVVTHAGPLTDLANVDAYLQRGVKAARMSSRGKLYREFQFHEDGSGVRSTATTRPVRLSRDPDAKDLPSGAVVTFLAATDVLAVRFRGPYPTAPNDHYAALRARAAELGLKPTGPVRHVLLSDPEAGAPAELEQELQLPVSE